MKRLLLVCGAVLVATTSTLPGWTLLTGQPWPDGTVPVSLELTVNPPATNYDWNAAGRDAIAAWNTVLQRVQIQTLPSTGVPSYDNGRNELFFDTKVYGEAFPSGVLAVTLNSMDGDQRSEADIVFNLAQPWRVYSGRLMSGVDFQRVAIHELGHVLGLGHPDEAGQTVSAIMNSTESDIDAPTADDVAGIRALYDWTGTAAPAILAGPKISATNLAAGQGVRFWAWAGGRGPYTYTWRRDGVAVPSGTGAILTLDPVTVADAGNYTLTVASPSGSSTSTAVALAVTPAVAPDFIDMLPGSASPPMGNDSFLLAPFLASGTEPMQWQWKHEGVTIAGATNSRLDLPDAQFGDSGNYTVTVSNLAGQATSKTMRVTVTPVAPPQFLYGAQDFAFVPGGYASLSANLVNGRLCTYQWYKDGQPIALATNTSFTLSGIGRSDAGSYTVTATSALGTVTSAPSVVTVGAPVVVPTLITSTPRGCIDYAGALLYLYVGAEGSHLSYRWFKDSAEVTNSPHAVVSGPSLQISYATESDSGWYTVVVSGDAGNVTSQPVHVVVRPPRIPVFKTQLEPYAGVPGDIFTLSVGMLPISATHSAPDESGFTFQWYKDGVPFDALGAHVNFTAKESDTGKYFVRATSISGLSADSDTVSVVIKAGARPTVGWQAGSTLLDRGDQTALSQFKYAMDLQASTAARDPSQGNYVLVTASGPAIGGIVPGTYVIQASRDGLTANGAPFTIDFLPVVGPLIARSPMSQVRELGLPWSVDVDAFAYGPLTYQWLKNGVVVPGATDRSFPTSNFRAEDTGSYTVQVTSAAGTVTSDAVVIEQHPDAAPVLIDQPNPATVTAGTYANFSVGAYGGALRYQWLRNGAAITGATNASLDMIAQSTDAGSYSVRVTNGSARSTTSRAVELRVIEPQRPPQILFPPLDQQAIVGGDATLRVGADGGPLPDHYQWRKNGVDIPGATDAELRLHDVQPGDAGSYSVIAYNSIGQAGSTAAALTVTDAGRLVNLATRARVGTSGGVLIAGFGITGTAPRTLLIRGVGDQLSDFGVHGVLKNPVLTLYDANKRQVDSSDDWLPIGTYDATRAAKLATVRAAEKQVGAFPLREESEDAALITTLAPGTYSAIVSGFANTTGVGLVEIYELGKPAPDRLINLSCRSYVGTGDEVVIPSMYLRGSSPRRVLVRAVGPGLIPFKVDGMLADPKFTVYRDKIVIAAADNWGERNDEAAIAAASAKVGAFPLDAGSKDAVALLTLDPGSYSIVVSGADGGSGIALVEVYEVPQ